MFSSLGSIPLGCVQGSKLGPFLFSLHTRDLETLINNKIPNGRAFLYADDSYVAISVSPKNFTLAMLDVEHCFINHQPWLELLGMACNSSKTELIVFGNTGNPWSMTVGDDRIVALNN